MADPPPAPKPAVPAFVSGLSDYGESCSMKKLSVPITAVFGSKKPTR